MSKPYDATGKVLFEADPVGWAAFLGVVRPADVFEVVDADLSAVSLAADKVLQVNDPVPWLLHVEFQAQWDGELPRRLMAYHAILAEKHRLPVATVVVLLAPDANASAVTGRYVTAPPFGPGSEFGYTVVRVWQVPADQLLGGPLALVPLAPIAADPVSDVLPRALDRVHAEAGPDEDQMLAAVAFLLQLRYGQMTMRELLRERPEIREYAAFQMFLEEGLEKGRAEGLARSRATLLRQGRKKFGDPTPEQEAAVAAVADTDRLDALAVRLLDVNTWEELLKSD